MPNKSINIFFIDQTVIDNNEVIDKGMRLKSVNNLRSAIGLFRIDLGF